MKTPASKFYWQLRVKRLGTSDEVFDLRTTRAIHIGDHSGNDICVESVHVPSRHRIVKMGAKNPEIYITEEIERSLEGKTVRQTEWKKNLYQGKVFKVTDKTTWTVGPVRFVLEKANIHTLAAQTQTLDPLERKHFWQSLGGSVGVHGALALLILVFGFATQWFTQQDEVLEVQRVSIKDVQEIFKPEPIQLAQPEIPPEEVTDKKINQKPAAKSSAPQNSKQVKKARTRQVDAAKGSPKKSTEQNQNNMGLLALASVKSPNSRSLQLRTPEITSPSARKEDANGVSISSVGAGIRSGAQNQRIAQIDGISSAGSYEGGDLGKEIQASTGPAIQLVKREIEVKGGLDSAVVRQIIEERLAEVRYCYENILFKKADLSGKVFTSWTIQPDGSVKNTVASSTEIEEPELHKCVQDRINEWKFPSPRGGGVVHVKYPFVFRSLGG